MKGKPISVLLDKDLFNWLDKHCKRTGKTKSGLVRAMLNEKKKVDDLGRDRAALRVGFKGNRTVIKVKGEI